jgi:hypothetical protein
MIIKPQPFQIDNINKFYYSSKELCIYNPEFFYGCKTKPRKIIEKKNIPESEFIYANFNSKLNKWKLSTSECKKAQLLFSREWVDKYFFKIEKVKIEEEGEQEIKKNVNIEETEPVAEDEKDEKENKDKRDEKSVFSEEIEKAPEILELEDNEKFKDSDGNIIEIETRGEKDRNKIFFKVKDVSKGFGMKSLNDSLTSNHGSYERGVDYKTFFINVIKDREMSGVIKKSLYLTYHGLLRVLFVSRNKNVKKFQDWAEEKLFTIQMGSQEEKINLGTNILNISAKTYKAVFQTYASTFPCIYLLCLGNVQQLRETFKIGQKEYDDDSKIYKYGFTNDLKRRICEHASKYEKLKNVKVTLTTFHFIDVRYTSKAETDITNCCDAFEKNLVNKDYNELIVINKKQEEHIKEYYQKIGVKYAGSTQELQDKIKDLENELKLQNEINERKLEKERNEKESYKYKLETNKIIFDLEKENLKLQIQILKK